ncbi:MAG: putative aldo/keto reductase-like oxidoreductase [Hyphomicrobiaceae bacterium]
MVNLEFQFKQEARFEELVHRWSQRIASAVVLRQHGQQPWSCPMPDPRPTATPPASTDPNGNRNSTRDLALAWLATIALAYFGVAEFISQSLEGINPSQRPYLLLGAAIVAGLVAVTLTMKRARHLPPRANTNDREDPGYDRRRFLLGAATATGGLAASAAAVFARINGWVLITKSAVVDPVVIKTDPNPRPEWNGSRVASYRRLGRTGFQVSDISMGSGRIDAGGKGEMIAREAIARGVNYFDTAPDYATHGSELALGKAMVGHRDKMFLATKFCTGDGHLAEGSSVAQYMAAVEGSLTRLQTDYVDLVHIHACDTTERLLDPNVHEAFDRLKEQGKARFLGVSTHTPNLETVADAAIDSGRFDVMMLAYHHGSWPRLASIIDRANAADIGIVAMKTLKGAKHRGMAEFRTDADAYSQAAFKWVLSNPSVSCLVVSFFEHQHVDEYLYASGGKLRSNDLALLGRYDQAIAGKHCFPHCGDCLESCPEELAINDVLRHRMYFEDYGDQKRAMQEYGALAKKADACLGCSAPCAGACPHNVPIRERMVGAHQMLTLA